MLEKMLRIGVLYDFYGPLLTDKQKYCIECYYLGDLSLAEIASELHVSRQAVHDIVKRSEQQLIDYEVKLNLVERYQGCQKVIHQLYEIMSKSTHFKEDQAVILALEKAKKLIE